MSAINGTTTAPAGFAPDARTRPGEHPDYWTGPRLTVSGLTVRTYWDQEHGLHFDIDGPASPLDLAELKAVHAALGIFAEEVAR